MKTMKTKTFKKKLFLNKQTIVHLDQLQMVKIKGGVQVVGVIGITIDKLLSLDTECFQCLTDPPSACAPTACDCPPPQDGQYVETNTDIQ
jgi:hypothetical protein